MPKFEKRKDIEYEPILFDLDGKEYQVVEKLTAKKLAKIMDLNQNLMKENKHNIEAHYRQLALYAGQKEDHFLYLMDKIDHRDISELFIWVDAQTQSRDIKKKKTK